MHTHDALRVTSLCKTYGNSVALQDVSFAVPHGQSCAIIGPNGAGKTTLIEIIMNLRRASSGTALIDGVSPIEQPNVVTRVGIQLQGARLFPMITVARYLALFSDLYGVPRADGALISDLGLQPYLRRQYCELSGGLQQRVQLALALLNDPDILILDEPTSGLDPIAQDEFWAYVRRWKTSERTLLLTSHVMQEVERSCDRVIVLADHRIVADGPIESVLSQAVGAKNLHEALATLVSSRERF